MVFVTPPGPRKLIGADMSTSIITTTTFTIATGLDLQVPVATPTTMPAPVTTAPESVEEDEIPLCLIVAHPRCAWTARKRCSHRGSCKS